MASTTTTRFMTPGYGDATARTTEVQFACPVTGTLRNMYVRVGGAVGDGDNVVYTLRKAGADTALVITLASNVANGSNIVNTVAVTAGDLLSMKVTKALSITTAITDVLVTCDIQQ